MARDDRPDDHLGSSDVIYLADRARSSKLSRHACRDDKSWSERHLLALASLIEPDAQQRSHWWREDGIAELNGLTADELVKQGASDRLETFLLQILRGSKD